MQTNEELIIWTKGFSSNSCVTNVPNGYFIIDKHKWERYKKVLHGMNPKSVICTKDSCCSQLNCWFGENILEIFQKCKVTDIKVTADLRIVLSNRKELEKGFDEFCQAFVESCMDDESESID